jgi:hypothetical protein
MLERCFEFCRDSSGMTAGLEINLLFGQEHLLCLREVLGFDLVEVDTGGDAAAVG